MTYDVTGLQNALFVAYVWLSVGHKCYDWGLWAVYNVKIVKFARCPYRMVAVRFFGHI